MQNDRDFEVGAVDAVFELHILLGLSFIKS